MAILRVVVDLQVDDETYEAFDRKNKEKFVNGLQTYCRFTLLQLLGLEPKKAELVNIHLHDARTESCDHDINLATDGRG